MILFRHLLGLMKPFIFSSIIFFVVNQIGISQSLETAIDETDYLKCFKSITQLEEDHIDMLNSLGYAPIIIDGIDNFLRFGIKVRSYLDLQSIPLLTEEKAKILFNLFFKSPALKDDYYKVNNSTFLSTIINEHTNLWQGSKLRARHIYSSGSKDFICLLEKDAGETMIQKKSPYYSDLINLGLRKKTNDSEWYLGGYEISFGQGLLLGHKLSFGQGNQFYNTEKFEQEISLKTSYGEDNYFTGLAIKDPFKIVSAIYLSSRLLDGYTNDNDEISIKNGGDHSSTLAMNRKNGISQYNAGIHFDSKLGMNNFQHALFSQYRSSRILKSQLIDLWSSTSHTLAIRNYRLFSEISIRYTNSFACSVLSGVSRSFGKKSGFSFVLQKNSLSYSGIYINHLFGNRTSPYLNYYFVLNQQLSRHMKYNIRYESNFKESTINRFDIGIEIKERKKWSLYLRSIYSVKQFTHKINSSIHLKKLINKNMESRTRFHMNYLVESSNGLANTLLAQDFIFTPIMKQYAIKIRFAFSKQSTPSNNIFAYENSPIGQFSINQYNETGFRYTLNFRWKWKHTTFEFKTHNWFTATPPKVFPLEIQLRKVFSSDDLNQDIKDINF